ncbi:MAG: MFS transporter [Chloroflexi bacterium]|nr:MFS transporter [Chloroflexota bacterium]
MSDTVPGAALEDAAFPRHTLWGQRRALGLVSLSTILTLSVWFSTNAIRPALETAKGFTTEDLAWLTVGVQLGFVFGTLVSSALNLADIFNARRLYAVSAVLAALCNLSVIPLDGYWSVLVMRFATGAFLAGVYPPAMKILSGWFQQGRGLALGTMIGALTLGSGSPHLLKSLFVDSWQSTIIGSTALAIAGGLLLPLAVADGPYESKAGRFDPRSLLIVFRQRALRLTLIGYLGHMWELYAMWAWIGAYFLAVFDARPLVGDSLELASVLAFAVFVAGAAGSVLGGIASDRYGRTMATIVSMVLSGAMAFVIGFLPFDWTTAIFIVALVWGASVIADSGQFSTATTELCDPSYRGTVLTFQTGLGFALTAISIKLVPVLEAASGWGVAFAVLGIGPVVGTLAMMRLRSLPEAHELANGRR